jgi:hypothetical protein
MDQVKSITSEDEGKTFTVPESRIGSASDAQSVIATLQQAEQTRSGRRAKINGLLNGNRPWSQKLLESKGQGERTNLNLREAEGFVAQAKTPYYDLVFEVDRFAQFSIDYGDDPARAQEWSDKVATRYHYALDDWDGMDTAFQRSQYQMIVHGAGPMIWENAKDWRSTSCMAGELLVPDNSSADVEEWETAARPKSYTPSDLWEKIKNESAATSAGWQVEATKNAIMRAAPEALQKAYGNTWESYEAEIRKGSIAYNNRSKRIEALVLYQKEFTGKISHFIVLNDGLNTTDKTDTTNATDAEKAKPETGFLFRKIGRFECFTQIVNGFLYDVGPDGMWHSVKGAGPKIFDFCEVSNRVTCRMVDGAIASSGLIVQAKDSNALQETAITHIASGVALHPGYQVLEKRIGADMQSPLLLKRDLKMTMDGNTGQYRRRVPNEQPYPTLGQEQMDASQQAMLSKGDVNRYYRSLDRWHRETFRRMLAMGETLYGSRKDMAPDAEKDQKRLSPSERGALEFYSGCIEDGVPEEVLNFENFCRIKATRSVGYGSAQMRVMIAEKLMTGVPMMDARSRNTAQRMWASALGGQTVADLLFPRYDTPQIVDSHMSLAQLENNFLRIPGGKVLVDASQDHAVHFQIHAQDIGQHAQEVQQQQSDPMNLYVHLEQAGPHMHEHLFAIQGDPTRKDQVAKMMETWVGMSKMADQLKQQLEEAAAAKAAQQPEQAPDPALIAALAKVHGELGIKREKMVGDLQLKAEKQRVQLLQGDAKVAHGIRIENFKATNQPPQMATAA